MLARVYRGPLPLSRAFSARGGIRDENSAGPATPSEIPENYSKTLDDPSPASPKTSKQEGPKMRFHELVGGGYNGALGRAFHKGGIRDEILQWRATMDSFEKEPNNVLTYNYLLSGHLRNSNVKGAFELLREMEAKKLSPNLFTFELIMAQLSKNGDMAVTVDELFDLMQHKYGIKPSSNCWVNRIGVWLIRRDPERACIIFDELVTTRPTLLSDPDTIARMLLVATRFGHWDAVKRFFGAVKPTVPVKTICHSVDWPLGNLTSNPAILTSKGYLALFYTRAQRISPEFVPLVRLILHQTPQETLDEGSYRNIIYFCSRAGSGVNDLALYSLQKLFGLHSRTKHIHSALEINNIKNLAGLIPKFPREYLVAFVECLARPSNSTEFYNEPISPAAQVVCDRIKSVLINTSGRAPTNHPSTDNASPTHLKSASKSELSDEDLYQELFDF